MKTLLSLFVLFFSELSLNAQITLEQTYPSPFSVYKLDVSGVKYVIDSSNYSPNFILKIYNTDHSLFKLINFPNPYPTYSSVSVLYISENLFDLDPQIEFAVNYFKTNSERFTIFNEDGTILFDKNKAALSGGTLSFNLNGPYRGIIPTPDGTKMILLFSNPTSFKVYSLPGTLPCWECDGGFTGNRPSGSNEIQEWNSNIFPNPTSGKTEIEYELPDNCNSATLTVYSSDGKVMKTFTITSDFDSIILSNDDYPSGTYFYNITTPKEIIDGKQFVIVR